MMSTFDQPDLQSEEHEAIRKVVLKAVEAMYNQGDIEQINTYYHPAYILLRMEENDLLYTTLSNRIELRKKGHAKGEYPTQGKDKVSINILSIIVVGTAATVHFKFFRGTTLGYDDFISLYKFKEGWRIVCQTTYPHES